ncbi:hypothetical protein PPERSA_03608 [Pseudocohnilembus persalinus]|uniref:C3H1-type domain-containing protein n=1 Tax=Pseudocohnilembus persalinus TaxID=266149 RepID=A0A0V0QDV3_PSEPJ|nr:hypothetical protein PPERSA_03608 [Pseudocohnilembus persalinus]|eukprot:KRX00387.1 hypothetical protein PPERSA_03608 [Pseudocohnilembus persalinus]
MNQEEDNKTQTFNKITEGITNPQHVKRMIFQMKISQSKEDKILDLNVLLETSNVILQQLTSTPCLRYTVDWLRQSLSNLKENEDIIDKIFSIYQKMDFTQENFDHSLLPLMIRDYKEIQLDSNLANKLFQIYIKNKDAIEKWLELYDKGEKVLPDHNKKRDQNKKFQNQQRRQEFQDKPYKKQHQQQYQGGQQRKKGVQFKMDEELEEVKLFKRSDLANAPGLTEEEYQIYQQEIQKNPELLITQGQSPDEIKQKDQQQEGQQMKQLKEEEQKIKKKLEAMQPEIEYQFPRPLKQDAQDEEYVKLESQEQIKHAERISTQLSAKYMSLNDIPDDPSYNIENQNDDMEEELKEPDIIELTPQTERDYVKVIEIELKREQEKEKMMQKQQLSETRPLKGILKKSKQEMKNIQEKEDQEQKKIQDITNKIPRNILLQLQQLINPNQIQSQQNQDKIVDLLKELKNDDLLKQFTQNINLLTKSFNRQFQIQQQQQMQQNNKIHPKQSQNYNNQYPQNQFNQNPNFNPRNQWNNNYPQNPNMPQQIPPQQQQNIRRPNNQFPLPQNQNQNQRMPQNRNFNNPLPSGLSSLNPSNLTANNNLNQQQNNNNNNFNKNLNLNTNKNQQQQQQQQQQPKSLAGLPDPNSLGINKFDAINQLQRMKDQNLVRKENFLLRPDPSELEKKKQQELLQKQQQQQQQQEQKQGRHQRTTPCVFYHSHTGCSAGETCDFIHNEQYQGKPVPGMENKVRGPASLSKKPEQNMLNYMILNQNSVSGEKLNIDPSLSYATIKATMPNQSFGNPRFNNNNNNNKKQNFNQQNNFNNFQNFKNNNRNFQYGGQNMNNNNNQIKQGYRFNHKIGPQMNQQQQQQQMPQQQ